jgi:hypothetical protein
MRIKPTESLERFVELGQLINGFIPNQCLPDKQDFVWLINNHKLLNVFNKTMGQSNNP